MPYYGFSSCTINPNAIVNKGFFFSPTKLAYVGFQTIWNNGREQVVWFVYLWVTFSFVGFGFPSFSGVDHASHSAVSTAHGFIFQNSSDKRSRNVSQRSVLLFRRSFRLCNFAIDYHFWSCRSDGFFGKLNSTSFNVCTTDRSLTLASVNLFLDDISDPNFE